MPVEGNALIYPSTLGGGNCSGVSFDPKLGSGTKNGYKFTVELTTDEENVEGFAAVGIPETYRSSGIRSFYTDETSVIRASDNHGGPSTKMDDPLDINADYPPRARRFEDRPQAVY